LINFFQLYHLILYTIYKINRFGLTFSLPSIPLNKYAYKNAILLVLFKKIKIILYLLYCWFHWKR